VVCSGVLRVRRARGRRCCSPPLTLTVLGDPEQWYSITNADIIAHGGAALLRRHGQSAAQLLAAQYPEHAWQPWRFSRTPAHWWQSLEQQRRYLEWLALQLGYHTMEDWYKVRLADLEAHGGGGLVANLYGSSPYALLSTVFADRFTFLPWKFHVTPTRLWDDRSVQCAYLRWLLHLTGKRALAELRWRDFKSNGGAPLLLRYDNDLTRLTLTLEPLLDQGHEVRASTEPLKTPATHTAANYWARLDHRRAFLSALAASLGFSVEDEERWYGLTVKAIVERGGGGLLARFGNSLAALLADVFPERVWHPWRFKSLPRHAYESEETLRLALDHLETTLSLRSDDDWRRVTPALLRRLRLHSLLDRAGGLAVVLQRIRGITVAAPVVPVASSN